MRECVRAGVLALVVVSCSKKDAETPPPDFSNPAVPAQPAPAQFALADFANLRYLEGTWRGTMENGKPFYESYHFVDDSTIIMGNHADSTFRTKSDSTRIVFRHGAIMDSSRSVYAVVSIDSNVVDFRASPTYHFTWTREGNDAWTARLYAKQPDGTDRVTTYPMKRVRR